MFHLLEGGVSNKLFGLLLYERFAYSPHVFICSIIFYISVDS